MNLAAAMLAALSDRPGREAVLGVTAGGRDAPSVAWSLDRRELLAAARAWRARFAAEGVGPGKTIALSPGRGRSLVPVHLAALSAGLTVVPLNDALTVPEAAALLHEAEPSLVVTSQAVASAHAEAAASLGVPWWTDEVAPPASTDSPVSPPIERGGDDSALVLFTSGTTGRPKSVPLSHGNLVANLDALAALWHRGPEDRLLHVLPAHHFHGLALGLYGSLLAGNPVFVLPRFDARQVLDAIPALGVTLLMAVPTMYARMLAAARRGDDLSTLRLAISGSAPLPAETWTRFHERFGVAIVERYGLTETGIVTSNPPAAPRAGSVGRPLPGVEIALRDEAGRYRTGTEEAAASPARGEICVAGPSVMCGYGNDDDATAAALHDGYFHTGDLGRFDADGYLYVEGRIKELILVGGSNVIPGEVERVLAGVPGVEELVAAAQPHADLGEQVALWVVASDGCDRGDLEQRLRAEAERALARYKRPRAYLFVDAIPRNAMGKIDRARLATG